LTGAWADDPQSADQVLCEVRDRVAVITLNRPDRLNAWTPAMGKRYFNLLDQLGADGGVRAVLLTGAGRGFCAGADVSGMGELAGGAEFGVGRDPRPYWYPMGFGKPVIAAIAGPCVGIGLQQALCCDVRFVAENAKLATAYAKRGLVGEVGITWTLSRIVGAGAAVELMLSGRTIGAAEALRIGLATFVVPTESLFDEAFAYARQLADTCSPHSMRTLKQQVYAGLMTGLQVAYEASDRLLDDALARPDFKEGVKAWLEKRPPDFPPLSETQARLDPWPGE
jgi:enoyl-CoA hydratase/carnithine racemase